MWKILNNGKPINMIVNGVECKVFEYDYEDDCSIEIYSESNTHLIEISMTNKKFHTEERRLKFVNKCKEQGMEWDCEQWGYIVQVTSDKLIEEINLGVVGLGWGETEDLMQNKEDNKEEIEFISKIISSLDFELDEGTSEIITDVNGINIVYEDDDTLLSDIKCKRCGRFLKYGEVSDEYEYCSSCRQLIDN